MSEKPLSQQIDEMHQDTVAGLSELSLKIDSIAKAQNTNQQNVNQQNVRMFFKNALKFYKYAGSKKEFKKSKNFVLISFVIFFFLALLTTVVTSISAKIYTTFTLLENVAFIIFSIFGIRTIGSGNEIQDKQFSKVSISKFSLNKDNLFYPYNKNKSSIKTANILIILGVIFNIIYCWIERSNISLLTTILEVLFCVSGIVLYFALENFSSSYLLVMYKGKNTNGKDVVIIQDAMLKQYFTLEEHKEKFSFLYK